VIKIRRMEEDVTDEVRAIEHECLVATDRSHEASPVNLTEYDPDVWLAFDGAVAVGFGVLVERPPSDWCPGWFLRMSGVLPWYQRQGIQGRLIRARVAHAREHGARLVETYTRPDNEESMRGLMRAGFKPFRRPMQYAGDAVVYWRKVLSA
jgi:ribosomal protein S18 acetylase RimI-like enzyme